MATLYAAVVKTLPVSKAYTLITFGAQSVLVLVGVFFLGERYEPAAWLGLFLVIIGLTLVSQSVEE
jgi:multidrug transporter EmrE-like cation transporter